MANSFINGKEPGTAPVKAEFQNTGYNSRARVVDEADNDQGMATLMEILADYRAQIIDLQTRVTTLEP